MFVNSFTFILSTLFLLSGFLPSSIEKEKSNLEDFDPPTGFYLVTSSIGTRLYRKDYSGGNPDYVQVIDLSEGASLELMHGGIAKPGTDRGEYGNDNPKFFSQRAKNYWAMATNESETAFCVTNGQFFFLPEYPTKMAHPLKIDGEIVTDGFGFNQHPWQKLMLEIWDDEVNIRRLSHWALEKSTAPDIIAGLSEDANKKAKFYTGRTFLGIDDRNSDSRYETVYIYNSLTARQVDAASILREFGADKIMMLDGGGSTQLMCQGVELVESDRLVPQAILSTRGEGPYFSAVVTPFNEIPLFVIQEPVELIINLYNNGAEIWLKDDISLVIDHSSWGGGILEIPIDKTVFPGQSIDITSSIEPGSNNGAYNSKLFMKRRAEPFQSEPYDFPLVFFSIENSSISSGLRSQIVEWNEQDHQQLVVMTNRWLRNNDPRMASFPPESTVLNNASINEKTLHNVAWIPASIFLFSILFSFGILKSRK